MGIRKDFYIKILEYAHQKRQFLLYELQSDLNFSDEERTLFSRLNKREYRLIETGKRKTVDSGKYEGVHEIYTIALDGEISLLEYIELQEAREEAKNARDLAQKSIRLARQSVWVAITTMVISIIISIVSIKQPVLLDENQYAGLLENEYNFDDHLKESMNK